MSKLAILKNDDHAMENSGNKALNLMLSEDLEPRAYIDKLPNELLLSILKHIFMHSRKGPDMLTHSDICRATKRHTAEACHTCDTTPYLTTWRDEDILNPFLFPNAISVVCRRWSFLAQSVPIFWTRIVAFIDATPTPLSRIEAHLKLSKDLPLDITVTRRAGVDEAEALEEHRRCRKIIDSLVPHFHRCRVLVFDVTHSTSLPSLSHDFSGTALRLSKMELLCKSQTNIHPLVVCSKPTEVLFTWALEILKIDGRNFAYALLNSPMWISSFKRIKNLHIANFNPCGEIAKDHAFTLTNFLHTLRAMRSLNDLTLSNVSFHHEQPDNVIPLPIALYTIHLEDLSASFLASLITCADSFQTLNTLEITRCPLDELMTSPDAESLIFREISGPGMVRLLRDWTGIHVAVHDCPAFDSRAVRALGGNPASGIHSLLVENCPNFTVNGLKETVVDLLKHSMEVLLFTPPGILDVHVRGEVPYISPEDLGWFAENISEFSWRRSSLQANSEED